MNGAGSISSLFDASGVFETCRVRQGRLLRLGEHLKRLEASMKTVGIFSWDKEAARREMVRSARGLKEGSVRIAVRRDGNFLVHRSPTLPYSARQMREGISVRTVPSRWPAGESGWAQAKTSERLAGVLAKWESPGAPEALRIGRHGYVTEGTVSNLFFVRDGKLTTAPAWLGVLEGVTRRRVIRAAGKLRVPVREVPFNRNDLFNAEEAFLTNVLMEVLPVCEVDGRRIGSGRPGPVTRRLMKVLHEAD